MEYCFCGQKIRKIYKKFREIEFHIIHCGTMGISACEKCINKKDETQNKGKKWLNLASFFGQKSLKY